MKYSYCEIRRRRAPPLFPACLPVLSLLHSTSVQQIKNSNKSRMAVAAAATDLLEYVSATYTYFGVFFFLHGFSTTTIVQITKP